MEHAVLPLMLPEPESEMDIGESLSFSDEDIVMASSAHSLHPVQSPRFAISSLWTASTENFSGQCLGERVAGCQNRPCHTASKTDNICSEVLIKEMAAGSSSDCPSSASDWETVLPTTRCDVLNWHPNRVLFAVIQLLCSRLTVQQKVRRFGKQRNPLHMLQKTLAQGRFSSNESHL